LKRQETPDESGYFGAYGGRYVPEALVAPVRELEEAYLAARDDAVFQRELTYYLLEYAGRPTPLTLARHLSSRIGENRRVYLKREDLLHTGSHQLNSALGQALLARRMGKKRLVAGTGAGHHGVACASTAALFDLGCTLYMGAGDMRRHAQNVLRMRHLGAEVREVEAGAGGLREAVTRAMGDWMASLPETVFVPGSALGPHPFPLMIRDLQAVVGREAREQILDAEDRLPDHLVAAVGGGSDSLGLFTGFLDDESVAMVGVEAGGEGLASGRHAASLADGEPGVFLGARTRVLQDRAGNIRSTHSIAAGLDQPAVGPEHAALAEAGRAFYAHVDDGQALEAHRVLARDEGIVASLETCHALAWLLDQEGLARDEVVLIGLSARGDTDLETVAGLEDGRL
jgi:tryptophan synthase beta chain